MTFKCKTKETFLSFILPKSTWSYPEIEIDSCTKQTEVDELNGKKWEGKWIIRHWTAYDNTMPTSTI